MELKDKLAKEQEKVDFVPTSADVSGGGGGKAVEASQALAVLGYSQQEIHAALKGLDVDTLSLEELIRQALRRMVN